MNKNTISIEEGNGGEEMNNLVNQLLTKLSRDDAWANFTNDSATYKFQKNHICFTTDSYIVEPIEFPGGNIGHLALSGTINDLAVMGADPIGISLALILEEGFDKEVLFRIMNSISSLSKKINVPVVTGDTKVMHKGTLDKIIINTSGIGIAKNLLDKKLCVGDCVILSGSIGEHGVALLSKRFDFQTSIKSDSNPIINEIKSIRNKIKIAKDPTRGGISSSLNEIARNNNVLIEIEEDKIPIKKEVLVATNLLGIDPFELANEGKFICVCDKKNLNSVLLELKKFNKEASIIGKIIKMDKNPKVILKTKYGKRILQMPTGRIVPRIC